MTEKDVVFLTLKNNNSIRISQIGLIDDSLSLESVKTGQYPTMDIEVGQTITPLDSSGGLTDTYKRKLLSTDAKFTVKQKIPGGGIVSGSLSGSYGKEIKSDTNSFSSSVEMSYSQPLLRNAWSNGSQDFLITIQQINNINFSLEQKKSVLSILSKARNIYWSTYEKIVLCKIFADRKEYAEKHLVSQRIRYSVGNATVIDTLSARLDYLESIGLHIKAQADLASMMRDLSLLFKVSIDSLNIDTTQVIVFSDLPDSPAFIAMVEKFDPKLKIFELIQKKITIQARQNRNQLLPDLRFHLGYNRKVSGNNVIEDFITFKSNAVISLVSKYTFPIRSNKIELQKTLLSEQKNKLDQEQYKKELAQKVDELLMSWSAELQSLEITRASLDIAEKQFKAAKAGFNVGTVDQLTLDKAETEFVQKKINLLQQQIVMKKLEIIFDEITGTILKKFGVKFE
jgi:outer membrane protein TolC